MDEPERQLQRTLADIHVVAKHLLGGAGDDVFVGVQPRGSGWRVHVAYVGFELNVVETKLEDALDKMLSQLMTHVGRRLDEGARILAALAHPTTNQTT